MSRLPSLSSKKIIRTLKTAGFSEAPDRGKGSHRVREDKIDLRAVWERRSEKGRPFGDFLRKLEQDHLI